MANLIKLVAPLKLQMTLAIILGVLGFLLSFGLGIFGGYAMVTLLPESMKVGFDTIPFGGHDFGYYIMLLIVCALLRGLLHYLEQFCNHFIAFRILAEIRHKVFKAMRRLAPAKLEGENQGDLISIIMGDIELLEVFYAHTISPIFIASIVTVIMFGLYASVNIWVALLALLSQLSIGVIIPMIASKKSNAIGMEIRKNLGQLNGKFLDELRGIKEVIQFNYGENALSEIEESTKKTWVNQDKLKVQIANQQSNTDSVIIIFSLLQLILCLFLVGNSIITPAQAFIVVLTQVSTFAPYIALANLGTTLSQTFACGNRVLNLLEEEPEVEENTTGVEVSLDKIAIENINFAYNDRQILQDLNLEIKKGDTIGIMGSSGSGKSTLLKLIMRFWDPQEGKISINNVNLKDIKTKSIYDNIDYMTQTTILFAGTLRDNLKIAKRDATDDEIYEALKKASIYDHVVGLKHGLDTRVSDLGDNFSGGERQRIGLARCFLTGSNLILLDEPTSNLDSYNEAIILNSILEEKDNRTVILVSHRESTLGLCDHVLKMSNGKLA